MEDKRKYPKKLERAWLAQLQFEHVEICRQRRINLAPPVFELTDDTSLLGSYDAAHRVLRMSRRLIHHFSWHVTLQVLRHEMAHQFCFESAVDDTGHGDSFQQACEILGVDHSFRKATIADVQMVQSASNAELLPETAGGRRCLELVEKLLALAGSGNEHEAASAMEKANELMEKNHLHGLLNSEQKKYCRKTIELQRKRLASHIRKICAILQEFFHVQIVVAEMFSPKDGEVYKVIDMFGTSENVAIAEYCFHFLIERLEFFLATAEKNFSAHTRVEKASFYLGMLAGFAERMAGQQQKVKVALCDSRTNALVLAEDQRLKTHVAAQYGKLTRSRSRSTRVYHNTFNSGKETGRKLTFNKSVSGSSVSKGRYLIDK